MLQVGYLSREAKQNREDTEREGQVRIPSALSFDGSASSDTRSIFISLFGATDSWDRYVLQDSFLHLTFTGMIFALQVS